MLDNTLDLPEDDPEAIGRLIDSLYIGDYDVERTPVSMQGPETPPSMYPPWDHGYHNHSTSKEAAALRNEILVYQAADKYGIPIAKEQAFGKIEGWTKHTNLNLERHADVLELVFQVTRTGDRLRDMVVKHCIVNSGAWMKDRVKDILLRHEPTAWRVGNSLKRDLDSANGRNKELSHDLATLR